MDRKLKRLVVTLSALALTSCAWTESSVNYTRGTEALERGYVATAIPYLEEAVRLDPESSRNHNNLASAYLAAGRTVEGWPHARKALEIDPTNEAAVKNCRLYLAKMLEEKSAAKEGDSLDQVREKLGEPDQQHEQGGHFCWRCCTVLVEFREGRVIGFNEARYGRR